MIFQDTFNIIVLLLLIFIIYKLSFNNESFLNLPKQDLEGLQNLSSMYKNGQLKITKLHVTDDVQFDKNLNVNEKITSKNLNVNENITSKNLHVNDHTSLRTLDIRNDDNRGITHFNHKNKGKNLIRGTNWVEATGNLLWAEHLNSEDIKKSTKDKDTKNHIGFTSFKYNHPQHKWNDFPGFIYSGSTYHGKEMYHAKGLWDNWQGYNYK